MPTSSLILRSRSPHETESIGRRLMILLADGAFVALHGELGAGKTCFVRGMADALGAAKQVSSPTFTLVHEYAGVRPLLHMDLYRLAEPADVLDLGYEELFVPDNGVCVVEWPERAGTYLPKSRVDVTLEIEDADQRRITIGDDGQLPKDWQEVLSQGIQQLSPDA